MKISYRHMMEQIAMTPETKQAILAQITAEKARRRRRPIGGALIAACICLALVGCTAFAAANTFGPLTVLLNSAEEVQELTADDIVFFVQPGDVTEKTAAQAAEDLRQSNLLRISDTGQAEDEAAYSSGTAGRVQTAELRYADGHTKTKYLSDTLSELLEAVGLFTLDLARLEDSCAPVDGSYYACLERGANGQISSMDLFGMYETDSGGWFTLSYYYAPGYQGSKLYTLKQWYDETDILQAKNGVAVLVTRLEPAFWAQTGGAHTLLELYGQGIGESELEALLSDIDLLPALEFEGLEGGRSRRRNKQRCRRLL